MKDAYFNGSLENVYHFKEAGLIAQELLQINDVSFVVHNESMFKMTDSSGNYMYDENGLAYVATYDNPDVSVNYNSFTFKDVSGNFPKDSSGEYI